MQINSFWRYIIIFILLLEAPFALAKSPPIEIRGVSGDVKTNVQARLAASALTYGKHMTPEEQSDFFLRAPENIRSAMEPFGYFKSHTSESKVDGVTIYTITPGPAVKVSMIDLKVTGPGKENVNLQKLTHDLLLKVGQIFSADTYNKTKDALFETCNNEGYLKAALVKKEIKIDLKNNTARISLQLDTGPRYYFGHVLYGPNPFAPSFLNRFISFKAQQPFSSQKLQSFQQDLRDSNYFTEVEATPDFDHAKDQTVPINVTLIPQKSQRYDVGVGYGSYTGPRLTLGTELRRVTDTGHHLNAKINISQILKAIGAKYFIPGKNPLTDQYILGTNVQYFSPENGSSFSQSLSASYEKKHKVWQHTMGINFLNERFRIENQGNGETHISQVLYPSYTISRRKVDDIMATRFGHMLSFTIQGASESVLSKSTFIQSEIKGKYVFSPTEKSRVLVRGDLGYTVVEDIDQLPLSLRYLAGGLNSVRGYPFNSIGPGKYLEVGSIEFQHQIVGNWNGAVFYDIGNASNTFNANYRRGAGIGVVYQSFMGPIELYVGHGFSEGGKAWSLEFNIGPDF